MQQLQPNTILQGGKYRIERVLGQGGFGNTYYGFNTVFHEPVAIKEFFMQGINDRDTSNGAVSVSLEGNKPQFEEQREKFKKEALRIRKLNNPHIIKVHDMFEENGTAYYVMDYVDGENLADRLKRTGKPMTESEVREILPQILNALKTVHDAGIWHLDLKPANIMIDKSDIVKLIDFGASKQLNAQKGGATTSTAISYTNGYAPREQMEQNYDKFGPWTDIYALGATLYTLLTNKRPPLPTDIDDDISEDKHVALPFPNNVSDEMKQMVLWMMRTNRNQRPQKISDLEHIHYAITTQRQDDDESANEETILTPKEIKGNSNIGQLLLKQTNGWHKLFAFVIIFIPFLIIWSVYFQSILSFFKSSFPTIWAAYLFWWLVPAIALLSWYPLRVVFCYIINSNSPHKTLHHIIFTEFSDDERDWKKWIPFMVFNIILFLVIAFVNVSDSKTDVPKTQSAFEDSIEEVVDSIIDYVPVITNKSAPSSSQLSEIETERYDWSGGYTAKHDLGSTYGGTPISIYLYAELKKINDNKYTGTIEISGYQIDYPQAKIEGIVSDNIIRLYFKGSNKQGMNDWNEICQMNDPLFGLVNENGKIEVQWFFPLCEAGIVTQETKIIKDN